MILVVLLPWITVADIFVGKQTISSSSGNVSQEQSSDNKINGQRNWMIFISDRFWILNILKLHWFRLFHKRKIVVDQQEKKGTKNPVLQ
jgi:hypothetical protein